MTMKLTEADMWLEAAASTASEFYARYRDQLVIHDADNILCLDEGIVNMSTHACSTGMYGEEIWTPVSLLWINGRIAVD